MIIAVATIMSSLTWLGLTIGQPATALRAPLGDPLLVRLNGISRVASYLRDDDPSAALNVTERQGVVFAIEILRERTEAVPGIRDPFGVALGATKDALRAKRGAAASETVNSWIYPSDPQMQSSMIYTFADDGTVESIKLVGSPANAPGTDDAPHLADPAGISYVTAIEDGSHRAATSERFRQQYLTLRSCEPGSRRTSIDHRDGRTFAIVGASCEDKKTTFYFDITRAKA